MTDTAVLDDITEAAHTGRPVYRQFRFVPGGAHLVGIIAAAVHGDVDVRDTTTLVGGRACRCLAYTCHGRLDGVAVDVCALVAVNGLAE
jgi:hypothetical protein